MVNIPITFDKEKMKLHTQTFDKPHGNGCPIDLRPKQASYSDLTQNYDMSENHSDGHLRTNFSNTNQQNIVANDTPTASPLVPHAKMSKITRRIISSSLGKVFDPLGLVTPVTLLPKILFQKTWDGTLNWDDDVGATITSQFLYWMESLKDLSQLHIPLLVTSVVTFKPKNFKLHSFVDASEKAYGAAIYAPSIWDSTRGGGLLIAKSRLAPKRSVSLPRLELCAMVLGVKLVEYVLQSLEPFNLNISISAWSDSTVAIAWIQSTPSRFQIFIANRIAKVQRAFPVENWKYLPTSENPADYCTRPVSPNDLLSLDIWWHGPNWIHEEPVTLPKQPQILENTEFQRDP